MLIKENTMFTIPVPKTALGRALERAAIVAIISLVSYFMKQPQVVEGSITYFVCRLAVDILNRSIPNF